MSEEGRLLSAIHFELRGNEMPELDSEFDAR